MMLVNNHKLKLLLGFCVLVWSSGLGAQPLSLKACLEEVRQYNGKLGVLRHDVTSYDLKWQELKANRWPKLNLSTDYKYFSDLPYQLLPLSVFNGPAGQYKEAQFGVPHNWGLNVQLQMPIYQPQIKQGLKGLELASDLGGVQVEKAEEQLFFEATILYYNAQLMQEQLTFLDSNALNLGRLLENMKLLRLNGLAKGTDVSKLELQLKQLKLQASQLANHLKQVHQGLNFLMGRPLEASLVLSPLEVLLEDAPLDTASPTVEWRILELQHLLLDSEFKGLKKMQLPTVSLVAQYGLTGFGYFKSPESFFKIFPVGFVGIQANYPLLNRSTRYKLAQKQLEMSSNRLQVKQLSAQQDLQLSNARLQKQMAAESLPLLKEQMSLAWEIYQQTLLLQKQGLATLAEVLTADHALRELQSQYLNAVTVYYKADLALKKALGNLLERG